MDVNLIEDLTVGVVEALVEDRWQMAMEEGCG